jgi:hypothetical protein
MSKILWIIVVIVVAVAIYNTFSSLGNSVKFESISALLRFPSAMNKNATATVAYSVGGNSKTAEYGLGGSSSATNPPAPKPAVNPPAGFTVSQLSPYYGQIKIGYPSKGDSYNPSQFSVRADYSISSPVDITGWSVKSNKGILFIPKAVNDYNPSGLTPNGDIILNTGNYVNFYSNFSPLGSGLRLNKCTGYLNAPAKSIPQFPNDCPSMYERSEISGFSGACQTLINSLWGCSVPTPDQINSLPYSDTDCRALLLNRLNYGSCYNRYHNNADFFSNEWRVWLQSQFNFDWDHDNLRLFDRSGLLVDQYIY